jgi:hypothetical protein
MIFTDPSCLMNGLLYTSLILVLIASVNDPSSASASTVNWDIVPPLGSVLTMTLLDKKFLSSKALSLAA